MTGPELARPIRLDSLGEGSRALTIEADAHERAALAARFAIPAIDRLAAEAVLTRKGERVHADGRLAADVVQSCVATGVDVRATIDEPFALRFVPARAAPEEIELDEGALDELDHDGNAIDLGEAVAQTLALALDPFPRAPDADAKLRAAGVIAETEARPFSAFAGLRDLRTK